MKFTIVNLFAGLVEIVYEDGVEGAVLDVNGDGDARLIELLKRQDEYEPNASYTHQSDEPRAF